MIEITDVEYKNIMSIGNTPIKLKMNTSPTTIVGGRNGSGKSSSIIAITYGLYGKILTKLNLDQAINSINKKNLLVKVGFRRYDERWLVVRGEKPKVFEIYRNDELVNQEANARDQQKFLDMILGMDYKVFTQLVVINKQRYTPFMEMNPAERRKIVEDILDISVFSFMNESLKTRVKENERRTSTLLNDYRLKNTKLEGQQEVVKQIQTSINESDTLLKSQIKEKERYVKELEGKLAGVDTSLEKFTLDGFDKVKKDLNGLNSLANEFELDLRRYSKDKKFFTENDVCPTCSQSIDEETKRKHIDELGKNIVNVNDAASQMVDVLMGLTDEKKQFEKIESKILELNSEKRNFTSQITYAKKELKELEDRPVQTNSQERLDKAVLDYENLEKELEQININVKELESEKGLYDQMSVYLKDDGIKAQIVKEYNAVMNRKINEYLNAMGFYVNMTIDENFKETFHSMNRKGFVYENLSDGQKCRVSIAIMLALLEIGAIKNSVSVNLLFLDELLEPIDAEGIKDVMNLVREKLSHKNVFVITQRFDEFSDLFQSQIKFELVQNFTEITN